MVVKQRSISPSKFDGQATGSPTKLSVPNRKIRNQPSNRVHDIEFAAEISTSLIAQVRNLQSLLAEREDELRALQSEKSTLEIDSENLQQRLKTLDESEHRYKEENWNLETRIQEITTQQKDAADREKKLAQALTASKADKTSTQKELDDWKLSHAKLSEEHNSILKHHDIELGTAKRNMSMAEEERAALQRKIDELTGQNQELAKAFGQQRGRLQDRELGAGFTDDEFETATDNVTPEHSPPASPVKGTPRHAVLETETVKTSLHHAQRTIQSQRSQIHREKTEKLELRRIIQDLRDELERARNDSGILSKKGTRKTDSKEFKKPMRLLGSLRSSTQEVFMDDPDWEDRDMSPNGSPTRSRDRPLPSTESTDQFETANETGDSAFETANERATETDDFQTGQEGQSDSDGAATETESGSRGFGRLRNGPNLPAGLARPGTRESFHSTASTSADEDITIMPDTYSPTAVSSASQKTPRFRFSRGPWSRSSRQTSEEPSMRGSPASFASSVGNATAGQSLFAELQDFDGTDEESLAGTPSQRTMRSMTPASSRMGLSPAPSMPPMPKATMVDSGMMTEPVEEEARPQSMESVVKAGGIAVASAAAGALGAKALSTPEKEVEIVEKFIERPPPELAYSSIRSENIEPKIETPPAPAALTLTSIVAQALHPIETPAPPPQKMTMSKILGQGVTPIAPIETPAPSLALTPITSQSIKPVAAPNAKLSYSHLSTQHVQPVQEPAPAVPSLTISAISSEAVEPRSPIAKLRSWGLTPIASVETQPISPVTDRKAAVVVADAGRPADPETPSRSVFGSLFGRGRGKDYSPVIAEDETRQSPSQSPEAETPESQRPFRELSVNSAGKPSRKTVTVQTNDQGAQTTLTGGAIDKMVEDGQESEALLRKNSTVRAVGSPDTIGTVRIYRSKEQPTTPGQDVDDSFYDSSSIIRPGSSASSRHPQQDMPPLPSNHKQAIQAARSATTPGSMGPPLWPASAMKQRPRTPSRTRSQSAASAHATPRAGRSGGATTGHATVEVDGGKRLTVQSRTSSVSSFTSELDNRFNMHDMDATGFGANTDPRMIQAITQTMIGEYLWKYTRKTGRGEFSENRHRRYFWVHPYTRTLYWSDRDPSSAGKAELKAKSVPIEAVRVVTDDNPMPPGLHRKSLVVISPGRTIKFTCTTGQRHETWFNALSYLLLRTGEDAQDDAEDMAGGITREDVDEFNPQIGRRAGHDSHYGAPPSVMSYSTRASRYESGTMENYTVNPPTLTPSAASRKVPTHRPSMGTLTKLGGKLKLSSLRSRTSTQPAEFYTATDVHDSAEDLREMIERQDRESDRLENVRACCDGKHDVGNISHSKRGRHSHGHTHSTHGTPKASVRSRA